MGIGAGRTIASSVPGKGPVRDVLAPSLAFHSGTRCVVRSRRGPRIEVVTPTAIAPGHTNGTNVAASPITPVHFENEWDLWTVAHKPVETPVSQDGHLSLNVRDAAHVDAIAASGIMQQWAQQAEFLLDDIDLGELVRLVMTDALGIADEALETELSLRDNADAIFAGTHQLSLPDVVVTLHQDFIQIRIAARFDHARDRDSVVLAMLMRGAPRLAG